MTDRKQINPRRPIPAKGYDLAKDNQSANMREGFPIIDGSFPGPDTRPTSNKGQHISRKKDTVQDISINLQDHDEAIMYYFNNVIKPSVITNGNRTKVPIIYGSPERWKSVQKDGFYRDKEGKIQTPLIMFKRDSVEKRRDLGNKLDGNNPQLFYTFQERYSNKNRYDNFSALQGFKPAKELYKVVVPDFIKLTYTCTIWCDYVAQMNKLIEMVNYTSDSYWGDPERFKFNAKIDAYNNTTEVSQGDNRVVKTNFGLTIQGYLVPDSLNKKLASENMLKSFTTSKISFNTKIINPSEAPKDKEQIRKEQGKRTSIKATDGGVGYQIIDNNNQIA
jgi:hypothetical protein